MTKSMRTNKWLRAALALVVLLGVLLCAFPALQTKAEETQQYGVQGNTLKVKMVSPVPDTTTVTDSAYYNTISEAFPSGENAVFAFEITGPEGIEQLTANDFYITSDKTESISFYNDKALTDRITVLGLGDSASIVEDNDHSVSAQNTKRFILTYYNYSENVDSTLYLVFPKNYEFSWKSKESSQEYSGNFGNKDIVFEFKMTHRHDEEYVQGTDPTCTENGLTDGRICSICGQYVEKQEEIPALGHDYDEFGRCKRCGQKDPKEYYYKVLDESKKTAALTGYEGYKKTLEIPETIDGYTIVGIGEDALAYNYYFEKVILPDTITTIGDYAFCSSDSLKEIDLPSSITKIGKGAFDGCNSLESITIPEKVTVIEDGTFYSNSSLKQVNLHSKITRIGNSAFRGCSSLDKVTIPSSVTTIDDAAFFGCDSLKEVTIPASVKSIGTMAFGYLFREGTEQEAKAQENIKRPEFYETHQGGKGDGGPMIYFVFDTYKDFVIKGYSETAAEKYANENKIKFVDLDGKLNGFVKGPDGKWAIYKNSKVDTSATGIFENENGWWRVENGYVNFKANGIYQNEYGWWKTTNGKVTFKETGVFQNENGWWRVKDSKVDFKANGIYQNKNGWWKTTNGKVTFKETGVFQNENGWWRVKDSKVDFKANGIYQNQYGWWKTTNGKVTFKENGVFQNEHGWWVVKDSKVDFNANGFYKKGNEIWKFTDGKITFKENGTFAGNDGKTVYRVKDSKVDTKDTGVYPFGNDMLKFTNGVCNYNENGIFKNKSGIWYLKDSKVDTDFTGFASNNDGTWYFESGKVNTKKTGTFLIEGDHFTLKNGELV